MKTIRVRYFALLREQRGQEEEQVRTGATTPAELYRELAERHRLTLPEGRLRVAINEEFGSWTAALREDDRVAFIPPVAGG